MGRKKIEIARSGIYGFPLTFSVQALCVSLHSCAWRTESAVLEFGKKQMCTASLPPLTLTLLALPSVNEHVRINCADSSAKRMKKRPHVRKRTRRRQRTEQDSRRRRRSSRLSAGVFFFFSPSSLIREEGRKAPNPSNQSCRPSACLLLLTACNCRTTEQQQQQQGDK